MNCPTIDKLFDYMDAQLIEEEYAEVHKHLRTCVDCRNLVDTLNEDQHFLKETLQSPTLPDDFASMVLDELEPYEQQPLNRPKKKPWKRVMMLAAGIVLAVGLTTTLNPSFAEWIGGLFSTEQVDEGLRMASDAGLAERVNLEVTNEGLTFKVEDIIADTSRVALSYQILNKNGKIQDTYLELGESGNEITAIDQNGNKLEMLSMGWQDGSDYGLIEFSLREQEGLKELTIKFDLVELDGKNGHWELEVPVDLKESLKFTKSLPLADAVTDRKGVTIQMKEVQFAPSANELLYETAFTNEEQTRIEAEIKRLEETFGEDSTNTFTNYGTAIQYHIENEQGETLYYHNTFHEQGHPSDRGLLQGSGRPTDKLGHIAWNESFVPQKLEDKLTFVLDGVIKTVPSDFSIKIKPKELRKNPVSFAYEGNFMTIKKADTENKYSLRKSLIPIEKETIFTIKMEGGKEAPSSDLGAWVLVDDKGKTYMTYHSGSILDEKDENGRFKTDTRLITYDLEQVPEELTLHLLSVTRYEELKEKWKVSLYEVD